MAVNTKYRKIGKNFSLKKNSLYDRISQMEPLSVANTIPLTWARAKDFLVFDDKGNKWIDLTSGIFVANAGHANSAIKQAIKKQLDSDLFFAYNYPTGIKEKFLKKLLKLSPAHFNCVTLLNSGSEVMDLAYKLIKLYGVKTGKKYIISFKGNYHGRGLANDLISGHEKKAAWSGLRDRNIKFLEFPYQAGVKFNPKKLPAPQDIAGFIIETFQGWGAWFYPTGFINDLQAFAKKAGALVCFDEMQSGFYRLGPLYGYQTYGANIKPDLICLGKGISSSLPLAAVLSRKEIFDIDPEADLHGTHSANALAVAAGLANLEFLSGARQTKQREKVSKLFIKKMAELAKLPNVKQINARGLIAGLIFNDKDLATRIVKRCIENGVLPVCTNRESIKIAPPLTILTEALEEALEVVKDCILAEAKK